MNGLIFQGSMTSHFLLKSFGGYEADSLVQQGGEAKEKKEATNAPSHA